MPKTDLLAGSVRWHDVAYFHLAVGDDHSVDQELHQSPSLIEDRLGQTLPHPLAEVRNGAGKPGELLVSVFLGFELSRLFLKLALALLEITPAPAVFVQQDDTAEIGLRQPLELLPEARLPTSESLLTCLEFLRQPLSAMRPCQGVRGLLWMAQQVTEIGPDQLVQAPGRAQPRWAFLFPMREQGRHLAGAGVVAVPVHVGPRQAGQAAHAATDQAAQQVGVGLVVALGKAPVASQLGLHAVELLLADERWDLRHQDPLFSRRIHPAHGGALARRRCRAPLQRTAAMPTVAVDLARIGWIGQQAADAGQVPAGQARRCLDAALLQQACQRAEAVRLLRIPGEHLADDGRLGLLDADTCGIARAIWIHPVAERRSGPRQHQSRLQLALAATPHALGDQRALILRDRTADLQQQLVMRILAHRAIEKPHLAAMSLQLLQQQDLMNVVARQTVRRGDDHQIEAAVGGAVPQAIETWPAQRSAAVAVIPKDMVERYVPALLARVVRQALNLL